MTSLEGSTRACTECGAPVQPDDTFCIQCGTRVVVRCPNCEQEVERTDAFCQNCGHRLEPVPQPSPVAHAPTPPDPEPAGAPQASALPGPSRRRIGISFASLAGAVALGVSAKLVWFKVPGAGEAQALDIPAQILGSSNFAAISGFELGLILIGIAVVAAAASFSPGARLLRRFVGAVAIVVVGLYVFQVNKGIGETSLRGDPSLLDVLGIGVYVALVAGVVLAIDPGGAGPRSEGSEAAT